MYFMRFILTILLSASLAICSTQQQLKTTEVKILIPLYAYPTWYKPESYIWPELAKSAERVSISAVINPNNGPGDGPPNKDYARGLSDLRSGGVTIFGYVFTKYGERNLARIKSDIDRYAQDYDIDGIFLDEAASSADKLDYYQEIYRYIKAKPNLNTVVLNQGTHADEGYLSRSAADIVVVFENYDRVWPEYQPSSYLSKYSAERFSCLIHSVPDAATMKKHIDRARERNIGYIYITDDSPDSPDRDPWNSLPSYWQEEVEYIQS